MATPIRIPDQLGPLLRNARQSLGYTQADVARRMGVTVQAISRLEANASRASFVRLHRLCQILGLEMVLQPRSAVADAEW